MWWSTDKALSIFGTATSSVVRSWFFCSLRANFQNVWIALLRGSDSLDCSGPKMQWETAYFVFNANFERVMNCPWCGSPGVYRHKIRQRMMELAQLPRPSIRGTLAAKERARKAALARWRQTSPEQHATQEAAEALS
jgi:hypothetical protein